MDRRAFATLACALGGALTVRASVAPFSLAGIAPRDPARRLRHAAAYGPDPRQKLDAYGPWDARAGLPMVVFFYGGSWNSGRRRDYEWVGDALASRGFVTIVPDLRLVPQVAYPAFVEDAAAAVRWAQDQAAVLGGDPRRLVLMGHSSGAYVAVMLALDEAFLRRAGVDWHDVKGAVGLSGLYDFYPFVDPDARAAFGAYPRPRETQPIAYAARPGRPPLLLVQAGRDNDVGPRAANSLDQALRAADNRCRLIDYPDLTHPETVLALSRPFRYRAPILEEATAFMWGAVGSA